MHLSKIQTLIIAVAISLLAISLISFPGEALKASIKGLNTWWQIVFPSLLPFFIISELLISFGVVKFIGVMLEPVMRPIFRVPGVGGFVWAMGMASGNPAGAKLAVRMRQEKQISVVEGERLVAFTSCANPLFIFGAVSVGFFQNPLMGIILGISHYVGNFFVGIAMRFYGKEKAGKDEQYGFPIKEAFLSMHKTRMQEKRPFGKILGDAVISSIQTLLMIGGFIILFSVLNRLLSILFLTDFLALFVGKLFALLWLPENLSLPFISGLFEMTIGSQLISETDNAALLYKAIVVSFLLAFGGFSIQAQVASILAQTDIRFRPFLFARFLHGIFSGLITWIIWKPLYEDILVNKDFRSSQVFLLLNEDRAFSIVDSLLQIGPVMTILSLFIYVLVYADKIYSQKR